MTRPIIIFKNIMMGTLYAEIEGSMQAINHITGEKADINFKSKSWSAQSSVTGKCFDSSGKLKYEISGSWLDKLYLRDVDSQNQPEQIWEEPAAVDNNSRQFNFVEFTMLLNHNKE